MLSFQTCNVHKNAPNIEGNRAKAMENVVEERNEEGEVKKGKREREKKRLKGRKKDREKRSQGREIGKYLDGERDRES